MNTAGESSKDAFKLLLLFWRNLLDGQCHSFYFKSRSKGNQSEMIWVEEVGPTASAPILQQYLSVVEVVRPQFSATPASPLSEFEAEAAGHPVFRIMRSTPRHFLT